MPAGLAMNQQTRTCRPIARLQLHDACKAKRRVTGVRGKNAAARALMHVNGMGVHGCTVQPDVNTFSFQGSSMKILLAIDGSTYTQRMLAYLAAHPELIGEAREFTALTVVSPVPPHVTGYIDRATLQKYYDDQAEVALKDVREMAARQQWKPAFAVKVGYPADVIAATAKEGRFDLLMMGSHGQSPLSSLVMGSVTSRVLAHCETPVLIVR